MASSCLYAGSQCSWYSFTATATSMYVNITVTATSGCHISSNVYRATGPCTGVEVSCKFGAPLDDVHLMTGLTIGVLYYVQVCYSPGGPCGNSGSAQFCIQTGVTTPPCNTCAAPCGTASGFPSAPTIPQVVAACQTTPFAPPLQPGTTHKFCYGFTATNTTVNFNVIITSNCGAGNVTAFTWELYNVPACGAPIQTGTLTNLNFTGLTVGTNYVFCYTFTVPSTCTHSQHCPYFVGAFIPLPVTWSSFDARMVDNERVVVEWTTASERNSAHFTIERSKDALSFEEIGTVPGAGNSNTPVHYQFVDEDPYIGISYYRVKQTDHDGSYSYSSTVSVEMRSRYSDTVIIPNPVQGDAVVNFSSLLAGPVLIEVRDAFGRLVIAKRVQAEESRNSIIIDTGRLAQGVYMLSLGTLEDRSSQRFIKN